MLGAAVLWGTTGTAQSFAQVQLSPYMVGALRLGMAALFFAAMLLLHPATWRNADWSRMPWPRLLGAAACMAAYNLMFFTGVKASSIAVGTALAIGSGPIWAGLLQFLLSGSPPPGHWWLGTLLAVLGGCLMVLSGGSQLHITLFGTLMCLGAGLSYAAYALLNKGLVAQTAPALVTALVFSLAAAMALPVAWGLVGSVTMGVSAWLVVGYLGVVATGLAYLLFSHGLRGISGATGVTLALGEPLTAFALALVVVGERPGWPAFAGLALLLAGLALVVASELRGAARA